jgi:hypothetical protein
MLLLRFAVANLTERDPIAGPDAHGRIDRNRLIHSQAHPATRELNGIGGDRTGLAAQ